MEGKASLKGEKQRTIAYCELKMDLYIGMKAMGTHGVIFIEIEINSGGHACKLHPLD